MITIEIINEQYGTRPLNRKLKKDNEQGKLEANITKYNQI